MRFLHTADLHLGLRVTRFGAEVNGKVREARLKSLEQMLVQAKAKQVDFILIAGDLFDDNKVDAVTSRRAFEMLEAARVPTYVLPGNHDPLTVDSAYERAPWNTNAVHILRTREPVPLPGGILLPSPLVARHSLSDPTRWIPPPEENDPHIRIGIAHGSLNDRPNLSPDDHLIDRFVVDEKRLDYLALGHWHRPSRHADRAGVIRAAYPGVPEPMGFSESPGFSIGWSEYSEASNLFRDDGHGRALIVTLDKVEAEPVIEEIDTAWLRWREETRTLRDENELSTLIDHIARRDNQERELLRLHLSGTLPPRVLHRLDELDAERSGGQGGIKSRYLWFELDAANLHAEPAATELQELAGTGIVRAVYDALTAESASPESAARARAALLLLYRYAQEVA